MDIIAEIAKNNSSIGGMLLNVMVETPDGSYIKMRCTDDVAGKVFLELKDHMVNKLGINPELLPGDHCVQLISEQMLAILKSKIETMNTREAFRELINQRNIGKVLDLKSQRVRDIRLEIKKDVWPSTDTMEEYLLKSGYQVLQEKIWKK